MDGTQEDKMLKITTFTHFASLLSLLIVAVLFILLLFLFSFDKAMAVAFSIGFLIDAMPALYLHIEYWVKNKGEEYEIRENEIVLRKDGKEILYHSRDIQKIIVYLSPSLYKNSNFHLLAIESYHYATIRLKTGEELVLTCLLTPRVDKALKLMKGVFFERKKKLFCALK
jgi:hypothetical protein